MSQTTYTLTPAVGGYSGNITLAAGTYNNMSYAYSGTSPYVVTGSTNATWATASNGSSSSLQVPGDAEFGGKVMINGQDIAATLKSIQERLAILVPDPKRLEKYEALKQAYEHYKTLEALCVEQDNPPSTT
jgi:hypothetical protein